MTNKKQSKQEFIEKQKKEYTIKVKTLVIVILLIATHAAMFVWGWSARSEFANEVKHEVRSQMSVLEQTKQVKQ